MLLIMITGLGAGDIFFSGLALAGMLNPANLLVCLDIFGIWDTSLGLVTAGGILMNVANHYFMMKHDRPIFDARFDLPLSNYIDWPFLIGSKIFGIGWGLAGFCLGAVVVSLLFQPAQMLPFLVALFAGAFIGRWLRVQGYRG